MFGIANKNYMKRPDSFIFGSTVFRLENIKVCCWAMSKICKGVGARTCFHILGDIIIIISLFVHVVNLFNGTFQIHKYTVIP